MEKLVYILDWILYFQLHVDLYWIHHYDHCLLHEKGGKRG